MEKLDWLQKLIDSFPSKNKIRKNLIDIAGYPSWENVNSNLLAFYFDKTEEHGFGTLFLDSLLDLIPENQMISNENDFNVAREVYTNNGNRIDIVISQKNGIEISDENANSDWAIIIENKINHHLSGNDLEDYWKSIESSNKVGIVLSKYESDFPKTFQDDLSRKGIYFYHVSHKALIEKVKEKMHGCFLEADDRHILFLKEFISNTNNFYNSENIMIENQKILKQFHENRDNILALKKQDALLLQFVTECIVDEFKSHGYKPNSNIASSGKHFYCNVHTICDPKIFRFYVNLSALLYDNQIRFLFELHNKENTKHGTAIKNILKEKNIFTSNIQLGAGGSDKSGYNHIYHAVLNLYDYSEIGIKEAISRTMNDHFWNHPNNFIAEAQDAFDKVTNLI